MNYYPNQLRRIAAMCEALDKVDSTETEGDGVILASASLTVVHPDAPDEILGTLVDEIGGAWSFQPVGGAN